MGAELPKAELLTSRARIQRDIAAAGGASDVFVVDVEQCV